MNQTKKKNAKIIEWKYIPWKPKLENKEDITLNEIESKFKRLNWSSVKIEMANSRAVISDRGLQPNNHTIIDIEFLERQRTKPRPDPNVRKKTW